MVPCVVCAVVSVTDACVVVCEYTERVRECQGNGNAGVGDGGCVVVVSVGHEYVCGTRGTCIVSSAADVLGMSVVHGMRGVGGVCEMCLAQAGWDVRGLGLGFTNRGVWDLSLCVGCYTTNIPETLTQSLQQT